MSVISHALQDEQAKLDVPLHSLNAWCHSDRIGMLSKVVAHMIAMMADHGFAFTSNFNTSQSHGPGFTGFVFTKNESNSNDTDGSASPDED
jgi:hypothetical protein